MIGKTISHYKILEKLGEGGMGVVYKVQDTKLDRFVALKFLPLHLSTNDEEKQRFIHEAKAASALDHPNICTIFEIDETEDGQLFIAMAYYEGETLKEKIERGPLKLEETIDIASQVARGLAKAHEQDIVHRDIKPANVHVTKDGVVKILDFGLAKLGGQTKLTKEGTTLGTVAYMSPEQARGEEVDFRTDIWSLGVVLYEMIIGQLPFKGDYEQVVMYSIMCEEPEPMTGLRTGVPMELERIVNKTLTKSSDERYQHVDEMLTDLKGLGKELDKSGRFQPVTVADKESRKKWLKRIVIPVAIFLLLVLGFFLVRSFLFNAVLVSEPKPIAVISFENQTGDENYNYLQKAIPNLLITSLEQSKYLRVTTWERMYDLLKQLGKDEVEIIDKDLGFELCRMDGVSAIVLGSFVKAGDMFATDVKVLDVDSKRILKSSSSKGKGVGSILERQIDELSKDISRGLEISDQSAEATPMRIAEVTTSSMDAYNYFLRGREECEKFHYNDALPFLEKAVMLDSTFATAYLWLARVYYRVGNTKARNDAIKKAKAYSEKATEKEKLYIQVYYTRYIVGDRDKRFHILKQITRKYPKEKRGHYDLAIYYLSANKYKEAVEAFNKSLELDANYKNALNDLATTYTQMENIEKAIECLNKYASVSPGDANPFDSMAELYFKLGRLDVAISKFKEALEVKPDFFSANSIAYVYALKEDYTEAMKWLNHYIDTTIPVGLRAQGFWWKGFYYYWLGNMSKSHIEINRATEMWESMGNEYWILYANWMKGWIYYDRGEYDVGWNYFKNPPDFVINNSLSVSLVFKAEYIYNHGILDLKQGRINSARFRLTELESLLHEPAPFRAEGLMKSRHTFLYAEILLAENSIDEAIAVCEKSPPM